MEFILEYTGGLSTMAELCRVYKISRQTGYKWVKRFEREKWRGLEDRNRAPVRHPNRIRPGIEKLILELRRKYPRWGPRKLRAFLSQKYGKTTWPAVSTIGSLLQREGMTIPRRKRRKVPPYTEPFRAVTKPNQVWCVDFKGWFRTGDGERIDPLTMTDAFSRYLLRCQTVKKTDTQQVKGIFESAFREYGMPWAIRSDNGPPFASHAIAGISQLSVYLMKLGITPERIQAGHPEQNGRHERMHRTLRQETANPPAANRRAQQKSFDQFLRMFNQQRPHEALGQKTPSACFEVSGRPYPERVKNPQYPSGMLVRRVYHRGDFKWKRQRVFLSETLARESIGLQPIDGRFYTIYFAAFPLGRFDTEKLQVDRLPASPTSGAGDSCDGVAKQDRDKKTK
jgi:transposase InsO family protein